MKSLILLAACCVVVQAATITITEVRNSKTPTQVAFQYCEASAVTITLTASPTGQLTTYTPNDINTSIFSNSNIDTDRASTIIGPNGCKTLVLGANWALQVATLHTLTLTAGSDSGSINFTTGIPALGNSSAWLTPANSTNWGNYPWPAFDWTNQGDQYIDPITGMMIKRVTGPGQSSPGVGYYSTVSSARLVTDIASAWTNPANILGSSGYASTSSTGSANALFIPLDQIIRPGFATNGSTDDLQIKFGSAYASGAGGQISTCLAVNRVCVGNNLSVALPNGSGSAAAVVIPPTPTGSPGGTTPTSGQFTYQPPFGPWGNPKITAEELTNFSGTVSISGTTVTLVSNLGGASTFFPLSTVSGDHIFIAGSSPTCTNNECTISALINNTTLTLNQNLGSYTGFSTTLNGSISSGVTTFVVSSATGFIRVMDVDPPVGGAYSVSFQDSSPETVYCSTLSGSTFSGCTATGYAHTTGATMGSTAFAMTNFGVLVWNSGSGTADLQNMTYLFAGSAGFDVGDDGTANFCSVTTVTVNYQADGVTALIPAEQGRMCSLTDSYGNPGVWLFIPQTGESRLIAYGNNYQVTATGMFNPSNPNNWWAYGADGNLYSCTYNASSYNYAAIVPNYYTTLSYTTSGPGTTCTNTTSGTTILQQVANIVSGFNPKYFNSVSINNLSGNYIAFTVKAQTQNGLAYGCWADITRSAGSQIVACMNTWSTYPMRWTGAHGGFSSDTSGGWAHFFTTPLNSATQVGIGQYSPSITSITGETSTTVLTGNVSTDPTTQNCQTLGISMSSPYYALGAAGNNCIQMVIPYEPQNATPGTFGSGYVTTSTTSITIGTGSQTFTVASGKSFVAGDPIIAAYASNGLDWMDGTVTSYSGTTLAINVTSVNGSGTFASWNISSGDQAQWPSACVAGAAQLQTIQPGDYLLDGANGLYGEQFLVAAKSGSGCSSITLVIARGVNQLCASAPTAHSNGWTPNLQATAQCDGIIYWVQKSAPTSIYSDPSNLDTGHTFIGQSDNTGTNLIQFGAYFAGPISGGYNNYNSYGARHGSLPTVISSDYTYGMNMVYPFAGIVTNAFGTSIGTAIQSHPGGQAYLATPPSLAYDGRPWGGAGGGSFDIQLWYHTLTLVSGQTNTYQITCPSASSGGACLDTAYPKQLTWQGWAGRFLLTDISGPSSSISDSNPYTFCYAYNAGECRSGSSAGNRYVVVPNADTGGICYGAAPDRNAPCLASAPNYTAQATRYQWGQNDPNANLWQTLGYAFNGPGVTPNYWNWHGMVDGTWILGNVFWKEGVRKDIVAIQLPPWPATDSVNRSTFVAVPVKLGGVSGVSFRIRFGYNPSLYCTSRQEVCATATSTGALPPQPGSAPFAYLSETQTWTACSTTCEIDIPGLSQHEMYYIVDRKNAAGLITSSLMQVVGVP